MRKKKQKKGGGRYFDAPPQVQCISSGARTIDRALGGGWAEGRVGNIIGDESTGKTLLAIEACANFRAKYPDADLNLIRYREGESAFDTHYARAIGLPLDTVQVNPEFEMEEARVNAAGKKLKPRKVICDVVDTVEELFYDLLDFIRSVPKGGHGLYCLDSLDSISDGDEMNDTFGKASYGTKKARLLGQLFRRIVRRAEAKNVTILIISQTREAINVTFGNKVYVTGGRALRFYSSQRVILSQICKMVAAKGKLKRAIGVMIRAKVIKNKVGMAFREVDFPIRFAYGIDDFESALKWLSLAGMLDRFGLTKDSAGKYLRHLDKMTADEVADERAKLNKVIDTCWWEVEKSFMPKRSKYGG